MAKVFLNSFGRFNRGSSRSFATIQNGSKTEVGNFAIADGPGDGAQVLAGSCSQDRVTINATGAFSNVPNLTVDAATYFIQVVTDGPILVWSGTSDVSDVVKQARAFAVGVGTYSFEVKTGEQVHVWTA